MQVTHRVTFPSGGVIDIETRFPQPPIIDHNAREYFDRPFDKEFSRDLALLATLQSVDRDADDGRTHRVIVFNADDLYALLSRIRLSDRECRRYMARRLYSAYSAGTLDTMVEFDDTDQLITGCATLDFIRAAQVMEAEGNAVAHLAMGPTLSGVQPTAKLIREVERWGGPREDVSTPAEYADQIRAYSQLASHADGLISERGRFQVALSTQELESVFRATAPIIESIARELLVAHGSTKELATLGPTIAEIQSRGIGGVSLLSQLNHVLKFGRDLSEHGHAIPHPVLRIACENAFQLAPQLASQFPKAK
jgi:hypothetical protein